MLNSANDRDAVAPQPLGADGAPTAGRILIVEDNPTIASAMAKLLERGGYAPKVLHSATPALDWVHSLNGSKSSLLAVIVDIHLPDLHGLVLTSRLRELLGPNVPIIIVSGDTSMANLNALPHVGATYFFPKPLNSATLLDRLRECLTSRPA